MVSSFPRTYKIAVIGDVHDQWEIEDNLALKEYQAGNENSSWDNFFEGIPVQANNKQKAKNKK